MGCRGGGLLGFWLFVVVVVVSLWWWLILFFFQINVVVGSRGGYGFAVGRGGGYGLWVAIALLWAVEVTVGYGW